MRYTKGMRVELVSKEPEGEIEVGEQGIVLDTLRGKDGLVVVQWDGTGHRGERHDNSGCGLDEHCGPVPEKCLCPLETTLPEEFKGITKYVNKRSIRNVLRSIWAYKSNMEERTENLIDLAVKVRDEEIVQLRSRLTDCTLLPIGCGSAAYISQGLYVMNLWNTGMCVAKRATIHFKQYSIDGIIGTLPKVLQLKQHGWLVASFENGGTLAGCSFMNDDFSDSIKSFHCGTDICMGSLTARLSKTMKLSEPNSISKGLCELEEALQLINTDSFLSRPRGDEFGDLRKFVNDIVEPEEEEEFEEEVE